MKIETQIDLQIYYGELLQQIESSHCYMVKTTAKKKLRAIELLLDIPSL